MIAHSGLIFSLDLTAGMAARGSCERLRWNARSGRSGATVRRRTPTTATTERRLRVGYVSADFYNHSAATTFMPVRGRMIASRCEIVLLLQRDYPGRRHRGGSRAGARLARCRVHFPTTLEALIRADEIDILVDLRAHGGQPAAGLRAEAGPSR